MSEGEIFHNLFLILIDHVTDRSLLNFSRVLIKKLYPLSMVLKDCISWNVRTIYTSIRLIIGGFNAYINSLDDVVVVMHRTTNFICLCFFILHTHTHTAVMQSEVTWEV